MFNFERVPIKNLIKLKIINDIKVLHTLDNDYILVVTLPNGTKKNISFGKKSISNMGEAKDRENHVLEHGFIAILNEAPIKLKVTITNYTSLGAILGIPLTVKEIKSAERIGDLLNNYKQ